MVVLAADAAQTGSRKRTVPKSPGGASNPGQKGSRPEDVAVEVDPHQDELLDEGVEETFPASDPVSVKHIT